MAWIAAVVGAAATYYGSQQQKKASKKVGHELDQLYGTQNSILQNLSPYISNFYRQANDNLAYPTAYYRALASGDTSRINEALAPQLRSIGAKYRSIADATGELMPRATGGAYNVDLAYRAGDEEQALRSGEVSGAYGNLGKLAAVAGDLGGSAAGHAVSAGQAAGSLFNPSTLGMLGGGGNANAYGDLAKSLFGGENSGSVFKYKPGTGWYVGNQPGAG